MVQTKIKYYAEVIAHTSYNNCNKISEYARKTSITTYVTSDAKIRANKKDRQSKEKMLIGKF